ncbi:hypothetical protein PACTADRAFT_38172 [Pachysolen tannophilus NRRL Y-2460]|uniref:Phosphoacetylglucosamine mutase n=1 Tax=Pachysolen tannophilus NRRL Y-2460 TaxID=669874 RepID=A0A1E4U2Z3_PACTA|nr:hypothetical protein PACTADRAFT_38172 [Pachysolen tannophilus NRRL Y-2460]
MLEVIRLNSSKHPKPESLEFSYGTAGFRMLAKNLDSVVFRVGLLASLRSKALNGKTIGIMITASHNPPEDNGVKLVDPMGEMLDQNWEVHATALSNCNNVEELCNCLEQIISFFKIDLTTCSKIVIARDSRESGLKLLESTIDGLKSFNTEYQDFGLLTTPQLHYIVRCSNDISFGEASENGYYKKLSNSFNNIFHYENENENGKENSTKICVTIDAANGIGADKIVKLRSYLSEYVQLELVNDKFMEPQLLNVACGADFVKTNQKLPNGINSFNLNTLFCSFDGDADRIVFYYVDSDKVFKLLDGDKIATLFAFFFKKMLAFLELDVSIGIIQTAYANGSSTTYIEDNLQIPVIFTPTGVKHLHHKALDYDVGIYFEANGHGTVLFSQNFIKSVTNYQSNNIEKKRSINILKEIVNLINQTVGDAISDLLAVLVILNFFKFKPSDWDSNYKDLPNKLLKVIVKDRTIFKTTNAERSLVEPKFLQSKIDQLVKSYNKSRSFVRASGTENAVRVYAEAQDPKSCDELADKVSALVQEYS